MFALTLTIVILALASLGGGGIALVAGVPAISGMKFGFLVGVAVVVALWRSFSANASGPSKVSRDGY